ncbi:hypothetical protein BJI47_09485 [Rhodococcus sp. 1168]|nr:hypothetical protein BJI47_09485 [Rhodococcus sp. 1168]
MFRRYRIWSKADWASDTGISAVRGEVSRTYIGVELLPDCPPTLDCCQGNDALCRYAGEFGVTTVLRSADVIPVSDLGLPASEVAARGIDDGSAISLPGMIGFRVRRHFSE